MSFVQSTIVVVEDKENEQMEALSAIKEALGVSEEKWLTREGPRKYILLRTEGMVAVRFASNLQAAEEELKFLRESSEDFLGNIGVLTDLMFPKYAEGGDEPSGLTVMVSCIRSGTPVVLCSDTYHHKVDYLLGVFPILSKAHPKGEIPIILDKKDWTKATASLLRLMAKPE